MIGSVQHIVWMIDWSFNNYNKMQKNTNIMELYVIGPASIYLDTPSKQQHIIW